MSRTSLSWSVGGGYDDDEDGKAVLGSRCNFSLAPDVGNDTHCALHIR